MGKVVQEEIGESNWSTYSEKASAQYGHVKGLKKNSLHIATTLGLARDDGKISTSLEKLCNEILNQADAAPDLAVAA